MRISHTLMLGIIVIGLSSIADAEADSIKTQLEVSPRHSERVKVTTSDERIVNAFIVYPAVKEPVTAVIVIHQGRGLTNWIRLVADTLAAEGFVAICPDLLSGMGPDGGGTESFDSRDDVPWAISELPPSQITSDLDAIEKYVRNLPSTNEKVAVSGFCWGGGQTFSYAVHSDTIVASFVFYGPAPSTEDIPKISAPVYGFYAENDNRINATIDATKAAADAANITYEPVIYERVGHAFLMRGMVEDANEAQKTATKAVWERWVSLLRGL